MRSKVSPWAVPIAVVVFLFLVWLFLATSFPGHNGHQRDRAFVWNDLRTLRLVFDILRIETPEMKFKAYDSKTASHSALEASYQNVFTKPDKMIGKVFKEIASREWRYVVPDEAVGKKWDELKPTDLLIVVKGDVLKRTRVVGLQADGVIQLRPE